MTGIPPARVLVYSFVGVDRWRKLLDGFLEIEDGAVESPLPAVVEVSSLSEAQEIGGVLRERLKLLVSSADRWENAVIVPLPSSGPSGPRFVFGAIADAMRVDGDEVGSSSVEAGAVFSECWCGLVNTGNLSSVGVVVDLNTQIVLWRPYYWVSKTMRGHLEPIGTSLPQLAQTTPPGVVDK